MANGDRMVRIVNADAIDEAVRVMTNSRYLLNRWAARYAKSPYARRHVTETKIVIEQIDLWIARL